MHSARRQLLGLGLLGWAVPARPTPELKIFGDDHYLPHSFLHEGRPAGRLVELLRASEPALALRYDIELMAWKRAMKLAQQGLGGVLGVSWTKDRAAWLDFSQPLAGDDIHVVVRRDSGFQPQQLDDLAGRLIGIGNGVSYGDEFEQAIAAGRFRVARDWGVQRRLRIVLSGRVDAAFVGGGRVGYETAMRAEEALWARRDELLWMPQPLLRDRLHLAFAKQMGQGALLERFNAALASLGR